MIHLKFILSFVLFSSIQIFSQQKNEPFAEWNKDHYEIIIDTNRIKQQIADLMGRMEVPLHITATEVKEGNTTGDKKTSYYYVLFSNNDQFIKIARYLKKIDNKLFLINERKENNDYQLQLISCRSNSESRCEPQLHIEKEQHFWTCRSAESMERIECERKIVMP